MEIVRFGQADIENVLAAMRPDMINQLAFGVINLDSQGNILFYNATEGQITGCNPDSVIGCNFFDEVAPCTKRPEFYGKFVEGVQTGDLDVLFQYEFDYQMTPLDKVLTRMTPTKVSVHMKKSPTNNTIWIMVKRLALPN